MVKYTEIILSIASFELIFIGLLILILKSSVFHYKILGLFLLTKGICIATSLLWNFYNQWYQDVPYLFITGTYMAMLFGPLIYLFIRSLITGKHWKWIDSVHFIPFILALTYFTISIYIKPIEEQARILSLGLFRSWTFYHIYWGIFYLNVTIYLIASWIKISQYNRLIKNHLSSMKRIRTKWLYPVLIAFFLIIAIDAAIMYFKDIRDLLGIYKIPVLETMFLIFTQLFIYVGLTQSIIKAEFSDNKLSGRYKSSKLNISDKKEIIKNIRNRMRFDHLYLDPELSIEKLSKVSGIKSREISQVVNEIANQNFFEFVNKYRLEDAMKQLSDPSESSKTVLEILYSVGFNSKSVFNSIFKKMTGLTPTQFRKQKIETHQAV